MALLPPADRQHLLINGSEQEVEEIAHHEDP
jgi:hypothetical protein